MSTKGYYFTDFKPDYQLFQQKISQLSSQKSKIPKKQINLQKLQHQLQLIKQQIDDQGFQYGNNTIFQRYASIQQLAQKKKLAQDVCCHCGQEIKKSVQCELCGQIFCKNCCSRKRVIPFEQHKDFRLCCEQCHEKYIKHFNNQSFYKQKGIYLAAIDQLQRKYQKAKSKYQKKTQQVNEYKKQKQGTKMKEGILKKAILQEQKRIKQLTEQLQKTVKQKAQRLKRQQQNKKQQQERFKQQKLKQQEQKLYEQQRKIKEAQEEQRKTLQRSRIKEEELTKKEEEIRRERELLEKERKELHDSRKNQEQHPQRQNLKQINPNHQEIQISEILQRVVSNQSQPTSRSIRQKSYFKDNEIDFDSILSQAKNQQIKVQNDKKKQTQQNQDQESRKFREQVTDGQRIRQNKKKQRDQKQDKIKQLDYKKENERKKQGEALKEGATLKDLLTEIKHSKQSTNEKTNNQFNKSVKKQSQKSQKSLDNQKSQQSPLNMGLKLTMNQIKTMNINDLLSMKIPMNPSASPNKQKDKRSRKISQPDINIENEQNSTTTENQKMYLSLLEPNLPQSTMLMGLALPSQSQQNVDLAVNFNFNQKQKEQLNRSIHSVHQEEQKDLNEQEKEVYKRDLLMRSSLISSTKKSNQASMMRQQRAPEQSQEQTGGQAQKCTCEIM